MRFSIVRDLTIEEKALLADIQYEPDLQSYFFKKLKGLHWLEPLYEKGCFSIDKMPIPVPSRQEGFFQIPYWPAAIYITNISKELSEKNNEESAQLVLNIIRECTQNAKDREISNYKVWYQFSQVLSNIPSSLINEQDIIAIEYWLSDRYEPGMAAEEVGSKFLKKIIVNSEMQYYALKVLSIIFSLTYNEKETGTYKRLEATFGLRDYSIRKITKDLAPLIGCKLQKEGVQLFELLLTDILDKTDRDTWSSLWRNAIEDHAQNYSRDEAENILVEIFRDSLLSFLDNNIENGKIYLEYLLDSKYQVLKRIAIYVISEHIQELTNLVPAVFKEEFFDDNYRHEVWQFMHKNFSHIKAEIRKPFLDYINSIIVTDDNNDVDEGATAYRRAVWLSSIKDQVPILLNQYNEYVEQAGTEPEHPDFTSYMHSARSIESKSPIPLEDLQKMEIPDLIRVMDTTDEGDGDGFRESGRSGLIKAFRSVVKNNPDAVLQNINLFVDKDLAYSHQIIEGFRELWKDKEIINWDKAWQVLLDFCQLLISRDDFWSEENSREHNSYIANRHWLVSSISDFIEDGVRSDEHAFDIDFLPQSFDLIITLLSRQEGANFDISHDSVSTAINSARGKCIEALINHALRSMRQIELLGKTKEDVWNKYVDFFNAELKKQDNDEFEFVTLVANYLPNFLYMENDWVIENLPLIFNKDNHQAWVSAFNGYSYVGTVYENIYAFLRDEGHFAAALDDENLRSQVSDKIIQGAVVAFIHNFEKIDGDNSLLSLIIERNKYKELHQIIWFSWTQRKKEDTKLTSKILELWPIILNNIDFASDDGKKIASDICDWIVFVEELSEEVYGWLYQVAPYAEYNHNSHEFLRGIHRLSDVYPEEAQKLWLRMLEEYSYAYPEDAIKGALSNFLKLDMDNSSHDGLRLANGIIGAYLKQDQEKPRDWLNELINIK